MRNLVEKRLRRYSALREGCEVLGGGCRGDCLVEGVGGGEEGILRGLGPGGRGGRLVLSF